MWGRAVIGFPSKAAGFLLGNVPRLSGLLRIHLRNGLTFDFPSQSCSAADNVAQWLPPSTYAVCDEGLL